MLKKLAEIEEPARWLDVLRDKGYFEPTNNPPPQKDELGRYIVPYWNILGYLGNVSEKNKLCEKSNVTKSLVEIIDNIISHMVPDGSRIENFRTDWVIVKLIFNLPVDRISDDHIEFVRTALGTRWDKTLIAGELVKKVFPHLLQIGSKELLLKLLDVVLDYRKDETSYFSQYVSVLGDSWLESLLSEHKEEIIEVCGLDLQPILLAKIRSVIDADQKQRTLWIATIEDSPQNLSKDSYETQLVFFLRDALAHSGPDKIAAIVTELLSDDHPIFRRLALYLISYYYKELNHIFWDWGENPIRYYMLKHEIFELFKNNCRRFTRGQIGTIVDWIETEIAKSCEGIEVSQRGMAEAYRKKEWLLSIIDSGDPRVLDLYTRYNKINPAEVEHPGYLVWTSGVQTLPEPEPFETAGKSNEEIAAYIKSLEEDKTKKRMWEASLASSFTRTVKENSVKFSTNLSPFLDASREFQHALLDGLYQSWKSGEEFEWEELLNFALAIVESKKFWEETFETPPNFRNWIVRKAAELIEIGTRDDAHSFDKSLLPLAEKILLILAENDKSEPSMDIDLVNAVLNSSKGAILSAMINYSLRCARLEEKPKWAESIKEHFEERICRRVEPSVELYVIMGLYLHNIYYLDKDWARDYVNMIFPKDDQIYWEAAMTGYLFASAKMYKEIYDILKKNGHYQKALNTRFSQEVSTRRVVEHIGLAYLNDFEGLDDKDSLVRELIEKGDLRYVSTLSLFFWRGRGELSIEQRDKILRLWEHIVAALSYVEDDPQISEAYSNLFRWIDLLKELDERTVELLKASVRHMREARYSMFLVDSLLEHVDRTPNEVGQIFLELLKTGNLPFYKEENILKLVETLYNKGEKETADRICQMYWDKELFFLKEIYDKYNA